MATVGLWLRQDYGYGWVMVTVGLWLRFGYGYGWVGHRVEGCDANILFIANYFATSAALTEVLCTLYWMVF